MGKIVRIHYPSENFFSFENGKDITDKEIEEWVNQVAQNLYDMDDPESGGYSYVGSGNTLVFGCYTGEDEIEIYVCKKYESIWMSMEDLENGIQYEGIQNKEDEDGYILGKDKFCTGNFCLKKNLCKYYIGNSIEPMKEYDRIRVSNMTENLEDFYNCDFFRRKE